MVVSDERSLVISSGRLLHAAGGTIGVRACVRACVCVYCVVIFAAVDDSSADCNMLHPTYWCVGRYRS